MTGWSLKFRGLGRLLLSGWGRRAGWAVLIPFLLLQIAVPALFNTPRRALFDSYQLHMPRDHRHDGAIIVAIDESSLKLVGQWPWPHRKVAELISRILQGKPSALGIDMIWAEPDRQSPEQWIREAGDLPAPLANAILQLPHSDDQLAKALESGPVVLGIGGLFNTPFQEDEGPTTPVQTKDLQPPFDRPDPPNVLLSFGTTLRSIPALDEAASAHGSLTVRPDDDGIFRSLPIMSLLSGRLAPSLVPEMLRVANNGGFPRILFDGNAITAARIGEYFVATQRDGTVLVNFSPHDDQRFVSAQSVLRKKNPVSPEIFHNKLVFLGITALGLPDQRNTPVGFMPGVEIQAQLLENILQQKLARRPDWSLGVELALTALAGLAMILVLPMVRARLQLLAIVLLSLEFAILGIGLWWQYRILLDIITPAIGLGLTLAALLIAGFAQADAQRRRLRLAAAKTAGELEAAHRIQAGILPAPASVAGDPRFDLDALMIPARQIGGDFFDFFKMDRDHLFFAVGDVSGKGMPAALFMALGKSLCKSCALRGEHDIGAIINRANREISRDNPEMLFITLFAGVLDLRSGELRFCNAGHDAPFLLRAGTAPYSLPAEGGPPLCILDDFDYPEERFQLNPADMLCVITDGITEAMTADGAVMGRARAEEVLAGLPANISADAVTRTLHDAADEFVAGAEPSDDLTILAVRWRGPTAQ
jgi:adenylate cyclase